MVDTRVANRYASALYHIALKDNLVEAVADDLAAIAESIKRDPRMGRFLESPETSRDSKIKILERVFGDRITAVSLQWVRLMITKRRENLFVEVHTAFDRLRREREGIVACEIVSAFELPDDQREALMAKLKLATGKTLETTFRVDPSLIGGVKVTYGNYVLDGTLRGHLRRLNDTLRNDLLKQV